MKNISKIKFLIILPLVFFSFLYLHHAFADTAPGWYFDKIKGSDNTSEIVGPSTTGDECQNKQDSATSGGDFVTKNCYEIKAAAAGTNASKDALSNLTTANCTGLVPCCPKDGCGWKEFLALIQKVINFLIFDLSLPITAIIFAYSGFLFMTSGDDSAKRTKGKKIFFNVLIGFVIAMAAWLIVNLILTTLISKARLQENPNLILLE